VIAKLLAGSNTVAAAGIMKEIEGHLDCWADRQQIQTILTHLLENSCFAVGAQQYAIVVAGHEINDNNQGDVCIEICDQGPGIPVKLREKVFTPFFSTRTDGTGLGLAIVRQIVENNNGCIEIDSNAVYGCIIRIRLPLPLAATP
jgi:two-component system sensor histidine kinase PilS (NtrC family)